MTVELGHVTDRKPPFKYASFTRVGFSDTDAQGIVYYGRYLPYFDSARVEYHRHLDLLETRAAASSEFVMRANTIEYLAPARFDDLIEVFVRVLADRPHERHLRVRGLPSRGRRADGDRDSRRSSSSTSTSARPAPIPESYRETIARLRGRRTSRREPQRRLETIDRIVEPRRRGGRGPAARSSTCCTTTSTHYSWVGIYLVEGDDLVLGPWKGPRGDRARAHPGRPGHLRRGCGQRPRPRSSTTSTPTRAISPASPRPGRRSSSRSPTRGASSARSTSTPTARPPSARTTARCSSGLRC